MTILLAKVSPTHSILEKVCTPEKNSGCQRKINQNTKKKHN